MRSNTTSSTSLTRLGQLALVCLLLLLQLVLRVHHITLQPPYVDEGFHSMLATTVWNTTLLPEHLMDGRILLYYYLSFFVGSSTTALFMSRVAIALFSLLSGAVVFTLSRWFHSYFAGVLALALYAVLPFTLFHERMILADPFAAAFVGLVAWRSIIFARHPHWRDGVILGVLLTAGTWAKLTAGILPLLPVVASIIYFPQMAGTFRVRLQYWLRHYFPPLAIAAAIMIVLWLPFLTLAYLSRGTPQQFSLIASMAITTGSANTAQPLAYIASMLQDVASYLSPGMYIAVMLAILYFVFTPKLHSTGFFLLFWVAIATFMTFGFAAIVAPRYVLPAAAPFILLLAIAGAKLWQEIPHLRAGLLLAAGAWLILFAIPFMQDAIDQPSRAPLPASDYSYYLGGTFIADPTTIQAAHALDDADPLIKPAPNIKVVYGDWVVCRLVYYYMQRPITCLLEGIYKQQLATWVQRDLAVGDSAYLIMIDTGPSPEGVEGICSTPFVKYTRANLFSLVIWRLQRAPCEP